MDIRQGKIRNINRKIIAGTLVFTFASSIIIENNVLNHIKLERQKYENFIGVASFEKMKKCFFLKLYNTQNEKIEYYIAERHEFFNEKEQTVNCTYFNLLDSKSIFVDKVDYSNGYARISEKTILNEVNLEEYLHRFGMIESMYSDKDVQILLEKMKQIDFEEKNKSK